MCTHVRTGVRLATRLTDTLIINMRLLVYVIATLYRDDCAAEIEIN